MWDAAVEDHLSDLGDPLFFTPFCANPSEPRTCIKMHELKCEPEINKYPYLPGNRWVCTICNERSTAVKPERDPYFMECPTCCQMFCIDCYEFTHTCEPELH